MSSGIISLYCQIISGGNGNRWRVPALVNNPIIVMADEPTSALDKKTGAEILNLCKELNEKFKTTFIFSSHDDLVASYCRRLITLSDGEIISDKNVNDLNFELHH